MPLKFSNREPSLVSKRMEEATRSAHASAVGLNPPAATAKPKRPPESGRSLSHLASRVFNTPLAIHPGKGEVILSVLGARLGLDASVIPVVADSDDGGYEDGIGYEIQNGIATIPIHGTLVKRSSGMNAMSGMTSYEQITSQVEDAVTNPDVNGILFDVDSPGGESAGMYDLADFIHSCRGTKPMCAVCNDSMYSAAYALGSCADSVYITREGGCGSIGCYMLHVDQSGMDAQKGLKYTYIFAGDHKVDGNPHEALAGDALATLKAEVDRQRDMFVALVSRNRNVAAQNIFDLQSGCLYGGAAVPMLADKIGSCDDAMADMMNSLGLLNAAEPKDPQDDPDLTNPDDDEDDDEPWWAKQAAANGGIVLPVMSPEQLAERALTLHSDLNVPTFSIIGTSAGAGGNHTFTFEIPGGIQQVGATAIPPHKTATSDGAWDGPANESRLKNAQAASYYKKAYAWYDSKGDGTKKSTYKFIHHEVSGSGDIGAANVAACRAGIANLNGARSAPNIPSSDRKGVYNHLAKHLRDAGVEPPPLKSERELLLETEMSWPMLRSFAAEHGWADSPVNNPQVLVTGKGLEAISSTGVIAAVRKFPEMRSSVSPGRKISLLLVPYDGSTCNLGGFKECYERGAFARGLDSDPRVLFNHDEACVLGRQSANTARFWEDAAGVHAEADAPDTQWANDLIESMNRGDITQASASFWIIQARWEQRGADKVRVVEKAIMREGSVHAFPAYENTIAEVKPASAAAIAASQVTDIDTARLRMLRIR